MPDQEIDNGRPPEGARHFLPEGGQALHQVQTGRIGCTARLSRGSW
jgi:hypothetical protein